jgi:hypothetical protein
MENLIVKNRVIAEQIDSAMLSSNFETLYPGVVKAIVNSGTDFIFYLSSELTEAQIDAVVANYGPQNLIKLKAKAIKAKYETHKRNGWEAYQDFRAKIVLDIEAGTITMEQAFLIEHDLKIAYDRIAQNGDWKTAYFELSQVLPSQPFVQPYLDLAMAFIGQYIQTNYES